MRLQAICRNRARLLLALSSVFLATTAGASSDSATIAIDTGSARLLRPLLLGCNQNFMTRPYGYETPQVVTLTQELHPRLLRYPAGGQSNTWDWEAANYVPAETVAAMRAAQQKAGFQAPVGEEGDARARQQMDDWHANQSLSVDSFMAFCAKMDPPTRPIWVANVLTGSPQISAAWVAYNQKKGYPNGLWELGNEHYLLSSQFKYPTAAEYLHDAEAHAQAMKAVDPSIRVSVTAAEVHALGSFQGSDLAARDSIALKWNEDLVKGRFYDALSVHDYFSISESEARAATEDAMFRLLMAHAPIQFPIVIDYYHKNFGPNVKIWFTEWNISPMYKRYGNRDAGRANPIRILKSLAHGLYVADWLLTATDYPDTIELACVHVLAAGYARGLFHAQLPEEQNVDMPFVPTAAFHALRMLADAWQSCDSTCAPSLPGVETLSGALLLEGRPFPALVVRAFLKDKQPRALAVINKSAQVRSLTITVDGKPLAGQVIQETMTAPARIEGYGQPDGLPEDQWEPKINLETRRVGVKEIVAPPYSLSVIRLAAAPSQ
ncbi:MAG: hypothetical protein NTW86_12350, partial [Candidatus Sumerlaeota bacterium]|nr:hypothetical protein [Candidatus Sumerlaeota bacterium]